MSPSSFEHGPAGQPPTRLHFLPQEMIMNVCLYLKPKDMARLAETCRILYRKVLPSLYWPEIFNTGRSVFSWACETGRAGTVEILLQTGLDPDQPDATPHHNFRTLVPLETAAHYGQQPIADALLRYGADVNNRRGRSTPLIQAIVSDDHDTYGMAKLFLEHGADPNLRVEGEWYSTPLLAAIGERDTDVIGLLLDYGADVNSSVDFPLHRSIRFCVPEDEKVVSLLLERGADPNQVADDVDFPTPLSRAIFECHVWDGGHHPLNLIALLVSYGADINHIPGDRVDYPVHHALRPETHAEVLRFVLGCGADPNITNPSRKLTWTPLHKAMSSDLGPDYVRALLDSGAQPVPPESSPSDPRSTPLGELISSHLEAGSVVRAWKVRRDWAKFRLLLEYGGIDVITNIPPASFAVLLSLTMSVCRTAKQFRKHLSAFSRMVWASLSELLALTKKPEYLSIWDNQPSDDSTRMRGGEKAKRGARILREMRDEARRATRSQY